MKDKLLEQQETIKGLENNQDSLIKIMKQYENYKLRVDKAIEYIENKEKELEEIKGYDLLGNDYWHFNTKLLEILKGEDKE